jgi:hypothetical protein
MSMQRKIRLSCLSLALWLRFTAAPAMDGIHPTPIDGITGGWQDAYRAIEKTVEWPDHYIACVTLFAEFSDGSSKFVRVSRNRDLKLTHCVVATKTASGAVTQKIRTNLSYQETVAVGVAMAEILQRTAHLPMAGVVALLGGNKYVLSATSEKRAYKVFAAEILSHTSGTALLDQFIQICEGDAERFPDVFIRAIEREAVSRGQSCHD